MRDNLFFNDPFFTDGFSILNNVLAQQAVVMNDLLSNPNTKVYTTPDGSTVISYSTKEIANNSIPTRAKKDVIANDYPITNNWYEEDGTFVAKVFLPDFEENQVYLDYKDRYLNVYATRKGAWKDILVLSDDGKTYVAPEDVENTDTKEIMKCSYVQFQSKEKPIEHQKILFDVSKNDITKLHKELKNGVLYITAPAREESKPALLTFND